MNTKKNKILAAIALASCLVSNGINVELENALVQSKSDSRHQETILDDLDNATISTLSAAIEDTAEKVKEEIFVKDLEQFDPLINMSVPQVQTYLNQLNENNQLREQLNLWLSDLSLFEAQPALTIGFLLDLNTKLDNRFAFQLTDSENTELLNTLNNLRAITNQSPLPFNPSLNNSDANTNFMSTVASLYTIDESIQSILSGNTSDIKLAILQMSNAYSVLQKAELYELGLSRTPSEEAGIFAFSHAQYMKVRQGFSMQAKADQTNISSSVKKLKDVSKSTSSTNTSLAVKKLYDQFVTFATEGMPSTQALEKLYKQTAQWLLMQEFLLASYQVGKELNTKIDMNKEAKAYGATVVENESQLQIVNNDMQITQQALNLIKQWISSAHSSAHLSTHSA